MSDDRECERGATPPERAAHAGAGLQPRPWIRSRWPWLALLGAWILVARIAPTRLLSFLEGTRSGIQTVTLSAFTCATLVLPGAIRAARGSVTGFWGRRLLDGHVAAIALPFAYLALEAVRSDSPSEPASLLGLVSLAAAIAVLLALWVSRGPGCKLRQYRWFLTAAIAGGVAFGASAGVEIRVAGREARRLDGLVDALHAYRAEHGAPPATLEELVPRTLPELPSLAFGGRPAHGEHRECESPVPGACGSSTHVQYRCSGKEFWLNEEVPGLPLDALFYDSEERYPLHHDSTVSVEPVGRWAYIDKD